MTKRAKGKYRRISKDLYQTPQVAVEGLLPFLAPGTVFREPCAASGLLVDHLTAAGHFCDLASDIKPLRADVVKGNAIKAVLGPGQVWITNPPWTRTLLHRLIVYLSNQGPTWLLFDADWAHTAQALEFKPRLRKVVAIGRVRWIFPGSKTPGFDNAAWYLFTTPSSAPTEFYGKGEGPPVVSKGVRICADCRQMIGPTHKWKLADRAGVSTPVHRICSAPTTHPTLGARAPAPLPLFDALEST